MKKVGILMGSDSDLPVVEKGIDVLNELGVKCEVHVLSAHRTPSQVKEFTETAKDNDFGVIICAAGMAAHLAGAVAANTVLPVIGLPVSGSNLDGLDALLSTVQMPPGIPVATVGVDAAKNAGILAAEIIAVTEPGLYDKILAMRKDAADKVLAKNKSIEEKFNN